MTNIKCGQVYGDIEIKILFLPKHFRKHSRSMTNDAMDFSLVPCFYYMPGNVLFHLSALLVIPISPGYLQYLIAALLSTVLFSIVLDTQCLLSEVRVICNNVTHSNFDEQYLLSTVLFIHSTCYPQW